ncbi:laccase domain-containing protein [Kocuria sp. JC486]|uniref:polyphenol oxidase family protein n=1 Tax=Kocuria sp. JC486 TaxID=1970736 RepID=UPI00141F9DBB|nr:polyphenol oxidase family protein [Kocuria sp. JC486]NHU84406.1 laccase domain-containing protein [Kocuria sp. JC486]
MYWYRGELGAARVAFTDRELGNLALHVPDDADAVRRRRLRLEDDLGVEPGSLLFLDQVHGTRVADADDPDLGTAPTADAAVSTTGRPLAVMVADCVPVLFEGTDPLTPDLSVTAVAHAGRNGLLEGVLEATVQTMRARGATTVRAVVGPCVCGSCYEVPGDMAADAERRLPGIRSTTARGTFGLDLPAAVVRELKRLDVVVTRPVGEAGPACTLENQALSSHRRDPGSGRIVGVVVGAQMPTDAVARAPHAVQGGGHSD